MACDVTLMEVKWIDLNARSPKTKATTDFAPRYDRASASVIDSVVAASTIRHFSRLLMLRKQKRVDKLKREDEMGKEKVMNDFTGQVEPKSPCNVFDANISTWAQLPDTLMEVEQEVEPLDLPVVQNAALDATSGYFPPTTASTSLSASPPFTAGPTSFASILRRSSIPPPEPLDRELSASMMVFPASPVGSFKRAGSGRKRGIVLLSTAAPTRRA